MINIRLFLLGLLVAVAQTAAVLHGYAHLNHGHIEHNVVSNGHGDHHHGVADFSLGLAADHDVAICHLIDQAGSGFVQAATQQQALESSFYFPEQLLSAGVKAPHRVLFQPTGPPQS